MTPELKEAIERAAADNNRSMNAEILARLEASFDAANNDRLADQMAAFMKDINELADDLRALTKTPGQKESFLRSLQSTKDKHLPLDSDEK